MKKDFNQSIIELTIIFYQFLIEGKAKLLLDTKFITETKQIYGTGAVTSTEKLLNYYGVIGSKIIKLSGAEQTLTLMTNEHDEIINY